MKRMRLKEGLAVPFLITKTVTQREPSAEVKSRFVGIVPGLLNLGINLLGVAKVVLAESFYEEEVTRDDGGVLEKKHYAVNLAEDDKGPFMNVVEVSHEVPCGVSFEFIQLAGTRPPTVGSRPMMESPNSYSTQARAMKAQQAEQIRREREMMEAAEKDMGSPYYSADFSEPSPEVFRVDDRDSLFEPSPAQPESEEQESD